MLLAWDVHHGNWDLKKYFTMIPRFITSAHHQETLTPDTERAGVGNILNCQEKNYVGCKGDLNKAMEVFKPGLVLISAGFDGYYADPLGNFDLTTDSINSTITN